MKRLIVVDDPADWSIPILDLDVISAKAYLSDPAYVACRRARVFNLCKSYEYQSLGYYVSLLAEARGHRPLPTVVTIQDMKSQGLSRLILDDLDSQINKSLHKVSDSKFTLSIYFGRTLAKRDLSLGLRLFELFRVPILRAQFVRRKKWTLQSIRPIGMSEVPKNHRQFLYDSAESYLGRRQVAIRPKEQKFWLAILHDPQEEEPPSNEKALARFIRAASRYNLCAELVTKDDYWRLGEYDALFIRATTKLNHYTYRFARKAEEEGLAVIDDSLSIARCTNKVFQTEVLLANNVPMPKTTIVYEDNKEEIFKYFRFPLVLKQPDSYFSLGVTKVSNQEEYLDAVEQLLERSDLIIAQEFLPTEYDWRVGVLDGKPIFVSKYFMARGHWQIMHHVPGRRTHYGRAQAISIQQAPLKVIHSAVKAARLIGDGLYGVDIKQAGNKIYVIEINDNPNIDAGVEDRLLGDSLYNTIMESFANRISQLQPIIGDHGRKKTL